MAAYPIIMLSGLIAAVASELVDALTAVPVSTVHAVIGGVYVVCVGGWVSVCRGL